MELNFTKKDFFKTLACITMLVDHIGAYFFPQIVFLKIIGRIAFPIFAFFIAEGFYYTKSCGKYIIRLLIIAIISQIPLIFLNVYLPINILFSFVVSLVIIFLINFLQKKNIFTKIICIALIIFLMILSLICEYSLYAIACVLCFYYFRNKKTLKYVLFAIFTFIYVVTMNALKNSYFSFRSYIQLFSIVAILPLWFYNNEIIYKNNFKYLFYLFYPLHLFVLLAIKFLVKI